MISSAAFAQQPPQHKIVQVYAHRGGRFYSPENTMPAYQSTLRLGADFVDMDVVLTKDGKVLISHDPVFNPDIIRDENGNFLAPNKETLKAMPEADRAAYNQKYAALHMTYAETQKLDAGRLNRTSAYSKFFPDQIAVDGTRMPLLEDVVKYVNKATHNEVGFQIEMKTDPSHPEYSADPKLFAKALYAILKNDKILDRAEIQAFDFRCLDELQKLNPKVKTAYLTSRDNEPGGEDDFFSSTAAVAGNWTGGKLVKDYGNSIPRMVKALGGYAWEPEDAELTKENLDLAHQLGLKVVVWTWPEKLGATFDPVMVDRLISWGIDGIITDDPARLSEMLTARGYSLHKRYYTRPLSEK
jgi:glycerophosphoryl diester phosphodiesterase